MSANSQPVAQQSNDARQAKDASQALSLQERKLRLVTGLLITFSPVALWAAWNLALGNDFIQNHAWRYGLEAVQVYVWLLIAAGLLQLIAVYVLRKSDQKPRDWISVASLIDAGLSIAFTLFFWTQISALIFRST